MAWAGLTVDVHPRARHSANEELHIGGRYNMTAIDSVTAALVMEAQPCFHPGTKHDVENSVALYSCTVYRIYLVHQNPAKQYQSTGT